MSYIANALGAITSNAVHNMHTGYPGIVISFDNVLNRATIQPLFRNFDNSDYSQVLNVPVAKYRFNMPVITTVSGGTTSHSHTIDYTNLQPIDMPLVLQVGDLVWCSVSERSIDAISERKIHKPFSDRTFDLSDSVVLCIL